MPVVAPDRIRNVALVGRRGSGKTSLAEALLYTAGARGRMGSVDEGTTASDTDPDEQARRMSISAVHHRLEWQGRRINLIDTPGEPCFIADALGALRVCEAAIFVVDAVLGPEVATVRLWERAAEYDVARLVCVTMLDRERADFDRTLSQLKAAFGEHVVATELPVGAEQQLRGVVDLVDLEAWLYPDPVARGGERVPVPEELAAAAEEARERLMDEVAERSEALMERYLDGEEIAHDEIVGALKAGTNHGELFPVVCAVPTRNLGTDRLLDAIVDDLPSPVLHGPLQAGDVELRAEPDAALHAYVFKTRSDPYAGRLNLFRVYQGTMRPDTQVLNTRTHQRERIGHLADELGPGDLGSVGKLKDTRAGDWLADRDEPVQMPSVPLPTPVMAFAIAPRARGDEERLAAGLRKLQEEDPTLAVRRDPATGQELVAGLSQIHVEVVVDRLRSRHGVDVELTPPRVPYRESVQATGHGHGRHKKQSGGRGQFGDCRLVVEPLAGDPDGFAFSDETKGGVVPHQFVPAIEKGCRDALAHGPLTGHPVHGIRVRLVDGASHTVDSSEMAFRTAGALALRDALAAAQPVLLEPVMRVSVVVPEAHVGDVLGDLSSRRGRPLGMEPRGTGVEVRAEVPMAEVLTYASDLDALTGGLGDHAMELVGYEPVPSQIAARLVDQPSAA